MKKLILMSIVCSFCYANDDGLYGTVDKPQINGNTYNIHQTYIESNQGFRLQAVAEDNHMKIKQLKNKLNQLQVFNFKSDNWAVNSKVERVLKQAASDGKLNYVLDQAQKKKLPASIAIVPIVESNYNKNAISPKGAGGAWQLMPKTASTYGLNLSDRFDFNSSTKIAIEILSDLYKQFGNWGLVFAAYNCGSQCVINALKKTPNAQSIDELNLPKETEVYVHRIVEFSQLLTELDDVKNEI